VAKGLAWDGLEATGAGFIFDRDEASVCDVLRKAQTLGRLAWEQMSSNGRDYVEQQLDAVKLGDKVWQALTECGQAANHIPLAEGSLYE